MSTNPWDLRLTRLEGTYEQIDKRLGELRLDIDGRFALLEGRFAQIDGRFAQIDGRFAQIDSKIDGLQWRMTALIVGTWITTLLAILLHR